MSRSRTVAVLIAAFAAALAIAALLSMRAVSLARHSRAGQEPVRPWMTVPYVAHSHDVPQADLWNALGIRPHVHDHRPIGRIARDEGRSPQELVRKLDRAIAAGQGRSP